MNNDNKKAMLYTIDALLAVSLLITIFLITNTYYVKDSGKTSTSYLSYDLTSSFSNILISEINNTYIKQLIADGTINNTNNTLIEQIAEFYVLNQTALSYNLTKNLSAELIPSGFGFEFSVNNEQIYNNSVPITGSVSTSKRMISGIEKYKPIRGSASKVYLEGILKKEYYLYTYFGGFVGQGNITVFNKEIPADATVNYLLLEGVFANNFSFKINNFLCGEFNASSNDLEPISIDFDSDCYENLINSAQNNFTINFDGGVTESYIGGGMIKIGFSTNNISQTKNATSIRYYLPEIRGVINIYDSVYVPGTINNMSVYLHYNSTQYTYLNLGGLNVYTNNANGNIISETMNDQNLTILDYDFLSNKTIPIRLASYNVTQRLLNTSEADVVLISDFSESMKNNYLNTDNGDSSEPADCPTATLADYDLRKTFHARCLDKVFLNIFNNVSGARIWPVYMRDNLVSIYPDANGYNTPTGVANMVSFIMDSNIKQGKQDTCLACDINAAYNIFLAHNESNKTRYIILMTDGVPTTMPSNSFDSNSTTYAPSRTCAETCESGGFCNIASEPGCSDNACDLPMLSAEYALNRTVRDFNVTVYTIGFGNISACPNAVTFLKKLANLSINGTYNSSSNLEEMQIIYKNIAYQVLERANQVEQMANVTANFSSGILYGDSYIEFNITPSFTPPGFGEIELITQKRLTQCNNTITIPPEIRVIDGMVTSYSGKKWTHKLLSNNDGIFLLSNYYTTDYVLLGDPFNIYVPQKNIIPGANNLSLTLASSYLNISNECSSNNSFIYKGAIKATVSYSDVLEKIGGCNWTVEYDDGGFGYFMVPQDYAGSKKCNYTNASVNYDDTDAYDDAIYRLFDQLDFDDDRRIFVNLDQNNLVINTILVSKVPYPWGPSIAEVRLWQ